MREICSELDVGILKGHVSEDHAHLFVSCPPHISPSDLIQRIEGRSSRRLLRRSGHLNEQCWGRHPRACGSSVASSGVATDEAIVGYIRAREISGGGRGLRVEGERSLRSAVGLVADC